MLRSLVLWTLCAALAPAAMAEDARDEEARGLFMAGRAAFESERYEDALRYFRGSYALSGRADLLYNIGLSAERAGSLEVAEKAFRAYLEHAPAERVEEVEARLAALASRPPSQPLPPPVATPPAEDSPDAEGAMAARTRTAEVPAAGELPSPSPRAHPDSPGERPWQRKWWVWTLTGAVVGGAVAATLLLRRPADDGDALVIQVPPTPAALRW